MLKNVQWQALRRHYLDEISFQNLIPLPAVAGAALVKPTKYHYYPHNQHIYLLPECAVQQVSIPNHIFVKRVPVTMIAFFRFVTPYTSD